MGASINTGVLISVLVHLLCLLPIQILQINVEHTCEGKSKNKSICFADIKPINTGLGLLSWYDTAQNFRCYIE